MWSTQTSAYRYYAKRLARQTMVLTRFTSSGSNPYPFPTHDNPSPYQIFHLPHNASKADIKRRYIDLVRIYHPDSPVSRALPLEVTDGRFQAVSKAYDALRGKTLITPGGFESKPEVPRSAAWRVQRARRLDLDTGGDDRWKDRLLILGAVFTAVAFVAQALSMRQKAMDQLQQQSHYVYKGKSTQRKDDRTLDAVDITAK